jgi:hypothetical protein
MTHLTRRAFLSLVAFAAALLSPVRRALGDRRSSVRPLSDAPLLLGDVPDDAPWVIAGWVDGEFFHHSSADALTNAPERLTYSGARSSLGWDAPPRDLHDGSEDE